MSYQAAFKKRNSKIFQRTADFTTSKSKEIFILRTRAFCMYMALYKRYNISSDIFQFIAEKLTRVKKHHGKSVSSLFGKMHVTRVYLDTLFTLTNSSSSAFPISRIVFDNIIAIASRQYCNPLGSRNTICVINKETVKAEASLRCEAGFKTTRMFRGKKQCCWMVLSRFPSFSLPFSSFSTCYSLSSKHTTQVNVEPTL